MHQTLVAPFLATPLHHLLLVSREAAVEPALHLGLLEMKLLLVSTMHTRTHGHTNSRARTV